jgi:hypothetical protein
MRSSSSLNSQKNVPRSSLPVAQVVLPGEHTADGGSVPLDMHGLATALCAAGRFELASQMQHERRMNRLQGRAGGGESSVVSSLLLPNVFDAVARSSSSARVSLLATFAMSHVTAIVEHVGMGRTDREPGFNEVQSPTTPSAAPTSATATIAVKSALKMIRRLLAAAEHNRFVVDQASVSLLALLAKSARCSSPLLLTCTDALDQLASALEMVLANKKSTGYTAKEYRRGGTIVSTRSRHALVLCAAALALIQMRMPSKSEDHTNVHVVEVVDDGDKDSLGNGSPMDEDDDVRVLLENMSSMVLENALRDPSRAVRDAASSSIPALCHAYPEDIHEEIVKRTVVDQCSSRLVPSWAARLTRALVELDDHQDDAVIDDDVDVLGNATGRTKPVAYLSEEDTDRSLLIAIAEMGRASKAVVRTCVVQLCSGNMGGNTEVLSPGDASRISQATDATTSTTADCSKLRGRLLHLLARSLGLRDTRQLWESHGWYCLTAMIALSPTHELALTSFPCQLFGFANTEAFVRAHLGQALALAVLFRPSMDESTLAGLLRQAGNSLAPPKTPADHVSAALMAHAGTIQPLFGILVVKVGKPAIEKRGNVAVKRLYKLVGSNKRLDARLRSAPIMHASLCGVLDLLCMPTGGFGLHRHVNASTLRTWMQDPGAFVAACDLRGVLLHVRARFVMSPSPSQRAGVLRGFAALCSWINTLPDDDTLDLFVSFAVHAARTSTTTEETEQAVLAVSTLTRELLGALPRGQPMNSRARWMLAFHVHDLANSASFHSETLSGERATLSGERANTGERAHTSKISELWAAFLQDDLVQRALPNPLPATTVLADHVTRVLNCHAALWLHGFNDSASEGRTEGSLKLAKLKSLFHVTPTLCVPLCHRVLCDFYLTLASSTDNQRLLLHALLQATEHGNTGHADDKRDADNTIVVPAFLNEFVSGMADGQGSRSKLWAAAGASRESPQLEKLRRSAPVLLAVLLALANDAHTAAIQDLVANCLGLFGAGAAHLALEASTALANENGDDDADDDEG